MNKYLNKRYEDDLTEIERMSMHPPATFNPTFVSKKIRMSNKSNKIKTTREEARFFGDDSQPKRRKRTKRAQQEHDLQRDLARPVQRKDPKYKNAAEVGIEKAKQKRAQPGKDWLKEVVSPPTKKIKMIVAENERPVSSSSKTTKIRDDSSKKPQLKSKKVTNKSSDKVTKPSTQLNKSRPRSQTRKETDARPSKSDKKALTPSGVKKAEKPKKLITESQKPDSDSKKRSKIEEFRKLLAEQKSNAEHVRETAPVSDELPPLVPNVPIIEPSVQQKSVLEELGSSSSQESNAPDVENERQACELCKMVRIGEYCPSCSSVSESEMEPEPEKEALPQAIIRLEVQDEMPSEIIEIDDDEDDAIPPCPTLSLDDSGCENDENNEDDDDVIFVSVISHGPIENLPTYHDPSTGQNFCYGQNLDEF